MFCQRTVKSFGKKRHNEYLKLAFPKTLLKVKSGSTGVFILVRLDMLKGNDFTILDTRSRHGHRGGKHLGKRSESSVGFRTVVQKHERL